MIAWLKALTHNALVHPLMMVLPEPWATKLHDRNADWAFGLDRYDEIPIEKVRWVAGVHVEDDTAIFCEVAEELNRGRAKFPGRAHMLAALTEETGEVARALIDGAPKRELREECVQVAAMAIRIALDGDRDFE